MIGKNESIPISELKIKEETKQALLNLGYTETGNFIDKDTIILAKNLSKDQYIDLAVTMAKIKAGIIWEEMQDKIKRILKNYRSGINNYE